MPPRIADELEEVFSLRVIAEAAGIRRTVPTLRGWEARRLVDFADDVDRHSGRHAAGSLARADTAFHLALVAGGGVRVRTLAEELAGCAENHRHAHRPSTEARNASLREHRQILASALEQDSEECVRRTVDHHLRTVTELVAEIDPGHVLDRLRIAAEQATGTRISALDAA